MAKIQITFQEIGQDPITLELSEEIASILDTYVQELNRNGGNFQGKADLFMKMTWYNWLRPVLETHNLREIELAGSIGQQYLQKEQELQTLRKHVSQAALLNTVKIVQNDSNTP